MIINNDETKYLVGTKDEAPEYYRYWDDWIMTEQEILEKLKKDREMKCNGIIPLICKRIICTLWKGHNYIPVSPEDLSGKRLFECKYCKKQHVW